MLDTCKGLQGAHCLREVSTGSETELIFMCVNRIFFNVTVSSLSKVRGETDFINFKSSIVEMPITASFHCQEDVK